MKSLLRTAFALAIAAGSLVSLTACAGESEAALPVALPAKNIETWSMPLDSFSKSESQTHSEGYAVRLLNHRCMAEAGFEYPVSWEPTPPPSRTFTEYGSRLFSLGLAEEFGYQPEPTDDTLSQTLRHNDDEINRLATRESDERLTSCIKATRTGSLAIEDDPQNYNGLWIDVSQSVRKTDELRGLSAKWRECMVKIGIPDLPGAPDDMPTQSMKRQFLDDAAVVDSGASQRELDIAVADATCQKSSGYVRTLYDRMWDGQVTVIREHLDELEAGKRLIGKNAERAAKVIDLYAPPAPGSSR